MLEQVTWGVSHSCEFCTLHVCTEQPPTVFTGRGTCLLLLFYRAVSTYRSKNCSTKEGFVLAQPCPFPLLAHCWPQSPCSVPTSGKLNRRTGLCLPHHAALVEMMTGTTVKN